MLALLCLCSLHFMPPFQPNFIQKASRAHLTSALLVLQCALVLDSKPVISRSCIFFMLLLFLWFMSFLLYQRTQLPEKIRAIASNKDYCCISKWYHRFQKDWSGKEIVVLPLPEFLLPIWHKLCCSLMLYKLILLYWKACAFFFCLESNQEKGGPGASGRVLPPVTGRSRVRVAVSSHCTGEGKACH